MRTRPGKDGKPVRDQLEELKVLLDNVDPFAKARLKAQILERVRSLVGYVYEKTPALDTGIPNLARVGFWIKAVWALLRGRPAMETLVVKAVENWLNQNLKLR